MTLYTNTRWGFELNLPKGWSEPSFFQRLLRGYDPGNPELYGPKGAALKFAIGLISPEPSLKQMQRNVEGIVRKYGYLVVEIASIFVLGKEHATTPYHVPLPGDRSLRLKNYHLIFNGIEFVATGKVALFTGIEDMDGPPPGCYHPALLATMLIPKYPKLLRLYAYIDDYDDIIKTFKLVQG